MHAAQHRSPSETQRTHGERVEARQAQRRVWDGTDAHARVLNAAKGDDAFKAHFHRMMPFYSDYVKDVAGGDPYWSKRAPSYQEWEDHQAAKADGLFFLALLERLIASAPKKAADPAPVVEETAPLGALTFIGKKWDGLRAVPATPVQYLGGSRPAYHGEYRERTEHGIVWHKVANGAAKVISYALPEAALVAANDQRDIYIKKENY